MRCCANDWHTLSARSVRTNEWRVISARHVHTNEWPAVSALHVVMDVMSQRARSRGETRVDNGLRGRRRNSFISKIGAVTVIEGAQHRLISVVHNSLVVRLLGD